MDITIKIGKSRLAYIPKALYEVLGNSPKATPNRAAVLLAAENTSIDDQIRSLDIIKADLLHAKAMQKKKQEAEKPCQSSESTA
jgi:CRISPR/Cas system-associated endonuclease Cas3-HD